MNSRAKTHRHILFHTGLLFLLVISLAGCKLPSVPALPFLNQTASITCEEIRIGILIGEDSNPIAKEQRDGYEMAVQEINNNGGIAGCEVQISYQTEATDGNSRQTYLAVRSLVEDAGVLAFLGGTSNQASMYAASLANYFSVPLIIPSAGGGHILPEDNRWAYQFGPGEDAYANQVFEMVKETTGKKTNIAVIFEESAFGNDAALAAVNAIQQNELSLVSYSSFDPSQTTYSQLVEQLDESNAQLVYIAFSSPEQAKNLINAIQAEEFSFTILARAGGFSSQTYRAAESDTSASPFENVLLATYWPPATSLAQTESFTKAFTQFTKERYRVSYTPTPYNAEAYKSMLILAETLDSILSGESGFQQDHSTIQDELRQTLLEYKELSDLWGNIDFFQQRSKQRGYLYPPGNFRRTRYCLSGIKAQSEPSMTANIIK